MLCKCSGKYIDIYFILKITFYKVFKSYLGGNKDFLHMLILMFSVVSEWSFLASLKVLKH